MLTFDQANAISLILSDGYLAIDDEESSYLRNWLKKHKRINYQKFIKAIQNNIEIVEYADTKAKFLKFLDNILRISQGDNISADVRSKAQKKKNQEEMIQHRTMQEKSKKIWGVLNKYGLSEKKGLFGYTQSDGSFWIGTHRLGKYQYEFKESERNKLGKFVKDLKLKVIKRQGGGGENYLIYGIDV